MADRCHDSRKAAGSGRPTAVWNGRPMGSESSSPASDDHNERYLLLLFWGVFFGKFFRFAAAKSFPQSANAAGTLQFFHTQAQRLIFLNTRRQAIGHVL